MEEKDKLVGEVIRYMLFKTHQNSGCPIKRTELTQLAQLSQQNVADSKSYVLISQLPSNVYKKYVDDENSAHLSGFTFVIVSIVHLAGGKITAESLFSHMRRMGLSENEESHPLLGNVKHALELLVQQRYLQKDNVNGPKGNTLFYDLAERSLDGPISDKIKEYVSQKVRDQESQRRGVVGEKVKRRCEDWALSPGETTVVAVSGVGCGRESVVAVSGVDCGRE
ncbi:hypothetical protein K1719_028281 [Acacia pycnantha]|nr:hypothetical protein K1719_028281 [Acacia pycnantha]